MILNRVSNLAFLRKLAAAAGVTSGTLYGFGRNNIGQLGVNDVINYSSPVQVGLLTTWKSIYANDLSFFGIKNDNSLWSWGYNTNGQLGQNNITSYSSPVQVGSGTNWSLITGGTYFAIAIKTDGTMWSWGSNTNGQLGQNNTTKYSSPVQVGSGTNWSTVNASYNTFALAIKTDGTLWAWGYNFDGYLGLNDRTNRSSPVQVGLLTTWSKVGAGNDSGFAIKTDGTLWSWGDNAYGELGQNNTTKRSSPVQVGSLTTWKNVKGGGRWYTIAQKTDGTLWSWGGNTYGQLGQNNRTNYSSPVQIGALTTWDNFSPGGFGGFVLASTTNNSLYVWGNNADGQLGLNNVTKYSSPVVLGSFTNYLKFATSEYSSMIIVPDQTPIFGKIRTWGYNALGTLGLNTTTNVSSPNQVGSLTTWKSLDSGHYHVMAIDSSNKLFAWGYNNRGQLGLNDRTNYSSPVQVGSGTNWSKVCPAYQFTTAIQTDGTLWAFGYNAYGQLGQNNRTYYSSPVQIGALTSWSEVSSGGNHTLAIQTDGTLWAFGYNAYGQLGQNNRTYYSSPVQVGSGTSWSKVMCGNNHSVALKTDGSLWSWGYNLNGQLGQNNTTYYSSPVQIGALTTWSKLPPSVSVRDSTFAIKTDGTLWAWGDNGYGQLGLNDTTQRNSPVQVGTLTTWTEIRHGGNSATVGLTNERKVYVWGYNSFGDLGLSDRTHRSSPVQLGTLRSNIKICAVGLIAW